MIFRSALTASETISLVASIGAVISAMFSAVAAFFMWRQNFARINIDISNDISTETPQNVYNNEHDFAFSCLTIHNASPRPITLSDCYIEIDKKKFHALRQDMEYSLNISNMELKQSKNAKRIVYKKDKVDCFSRVPIELTSFQAKELLLIFPDFMHANASVLMGTICFEYEKLRIKRKKVILHKLAGVS